MTAAIAFTASKSPLLDAEGIARAVATSTRRERALAKLAKVALSARLHALVGGDEVARGKPAPDIFVEAAARLRIHFGIIYQCGDFLKSPALSFTIKPVCYFDNNLPQRTFSIPRSDQGVNHDRYLLIPLRLG